MAKKDNDVVDEPVVEEIIAEEPVVELDKPTEVEGDLVENAVLEEASDEPVEEVADTVEEDQVDDDTVEESEDEESVSEPVVDEVVEAIDPGAFQPKGDYSFEVTTADGKTVKITSQAEADAFAERLDNEENLLTARQFLQFGRQVAKMDNGIAREESEFQTQKDAFEAQQVSEKARSEQVNQWSNELKYLQAKDLIPEIPKNIDVAGGWDKNPEDPGVKARMDIFKWMETENNDRRAAGIAEITSAVDAFRLMQADTTEQADKVERTTERTTRQSKGKMVTGGSSFTPENTQKDSIVGEGGSLRDLVTEFSASQ